MRLYWDSDAACAIFGEEKDDKVLVNFNGILVRALKMPMKLYGAQVTLYEDGEKRNRLSYLKNFKKCDFKYFTMVHC